MSERDTIIYEKRAREAGYRDGYKDGFAAGYQAGVNTHTVPSDTYDKKYWNWRFPKRDICCIICGVDLNAEFLCTRDNCPRKVC